MKNTKCDNIYHDTINMTGEAKDTLFQLAECFISGYDLSKLRDMLCSADDGVILDGLFICKEVGRLVCQVRDQISPLLTSPDNDIRKMADEVNRICEKYDCAHSG